ncbi:hypothetical protein ACJQWK_00937 [Exserohilum turcicum]
MYFLSLILALTTHLLGASAAPTHSTLPNPLAIPNPNFPTYDTDLAAAIAYARSHPAPSIHAALISAHDENSEATTPTPTSTTSTDANTNTAPSKQNIQCGVYTNIGGHFSFPIYTTEQYCNETEEAEEMDEFFNFYCGFCIVFHGESTDFLAWDFERGS